MTVSELVAFKTTEFYWGYYCKNRSLPLALTVVEPGLQQRRDTGLSSKCKDTEGVGGGGGRGSSTAGRRNTKRKRQITEQT